MRNIHIIFYFFILFCTKTSAQRGIWRNLYIPNTPLSTNIQDLAFDKDTNFYTITDTLLFRYNLGVWTKIAPPLNAHEQLKYLAIDGQGSIWVYVEDRGVLRLSNNIWHRFDISNSILFSNFLFYMKYDSISKLMIFGTGNRVVTYNSLTDVWTDIGLPPNYTLNFFDPDDLKIHANGDWYFSALSRRVYIYKPQTRVWSTLTDFPVLCFNCQISFDSKNSLYATTGDTLIFRYDTTTKSWKNLAFRKNIDYRFVGLVGDTKNRIWYFSQDAGIMRFDSLKYDKFTKSNSPLYSDTVNRIVVGPNNLKYIVGKGGGVQILDDSNVPLSIKETRLQTVKMISEYNNPIQERLVLHFNKERPLSKMTIQIHNTSGQLMNQYALEDKQDVVELNTAAMPSGMYFVSCIDLQNLEKETIKIVKY